MQPKVLKYYIKPTAFLACESETAYKPELMSYRVIYVLFTFIFMSVSCTTINQRTQPVVCSRPSLLEDVLEPSKPELVGLDTAFSLKLFFLCSCDACLLIRLLFGQPTSPWYNPMYVH